MTHTLAARADRHDRKPLLRAVRIGQRILGARALARKVFAGGALIGVVLIAGSAALIVTTGDTSASAAAIAPAIANTHATGGTCAGVTVVVDFSDLGGKIEVGCAEGDQPTGREALVAAGFTATDSQPGFLCAINAMPDPCPETFEGSFWSYWHSAPEGKWSSYQVGADSSSPALGEVEGWRYNDGTTPPGIAPSEAAATVSPAPTPEASELPNVAIPGADEHVTNTQGNPDEQRATQTLAIVATSLGLVALIVALIVLRRRRSRDGTDSPEARD